MRFGKTQTSVWFLVLIPILLLVLLRQAEIVHAQQNAAGPAKEEQSGAAAPSPSLAPTPSSPAPGQHTSPAFGGKVPWNSEDWDSLTLDTSDLRPDTPIIGAKDQTADFTRELLQVRWRFDDPIDLWVIKPRNVEKPPVVLYLYGYPSETDRFRDDRYCQRVTRGGVAAIGFVSALTGQRYHDIPMKQWFVSELQQSLVETTHDVQMILNYLSARGDFDMDKVGMFGQGSGATIAILAAAVDPRIKVINLLDPWGDWPDWMALSERIPDEERPNYIKPEFLKQVAPFDPILWLPKLETRPVRIVNVMDDPITPEICKKKIDAAAVRGSAEIVNYDDVEAMHIASYDGKAFDWIKQQLKPAPNESAAK
jgi:hypothetical protein